jgi:hypothetical protein
MNVSEPFVLPGLMPRKDFAKAMGVCERTIVRQVAAGKVVEVALGKLRLIDVEKTAVRMRGEDKRRGGRAA